MKFNEYMDYVKVRDFAWEILLREGVHELPVKTAALCRQMGVDVKLSSTLDTGGQKHGDRRPGADSYKIRRYPGTAAIQYDA